MGKATLQMMLVLGLLAALSGLGLALDEGTRKAAMIGTYLFVGGIVFVAVGIGGQAVVAALKSKDFDE
jgi:hypothetical protein